MGKTSSKLKERRAQSTPKTLTLILDFYCFHDFGDLVKLIGLLLLLKSNTWRIIDEVEKRG
ncbi:CLUMA_CG000332, isoform A [Clunio marinus]|uniref:CLUMA_CG000332, isoform A n=1 Tax=Clunio marinus TaxID=568069 RepID=A0A1J1HGC4_9DIPT|nr:CLUMA_CG000332, isoform A [Clunio marinus]